MNFKVFSIMLILFSSIQPWCKADDISDFMIEGMSVGDSALNFFSKKDLEEYKKLGFVYEDKKFYVTGSILSKKFQNL